MLVAAAGLPLLCFGSDGGLYILLAGTSLTFCGAGTSAWVLLAEINR